MHFIVWLKLHPGVIMPYQVDSSTHAAQLFKEQFPAVTRDPDVVICVMDVLTRIQWHTPAGMVPLPELAAVAVPPHAWGSEAPMPAADPRALGYIGLRPPESTEEAPELTIEEEEEDEVAEVGPRQYVRDIPVLNYRELAWRSASKYPGHRVWYRRTKLLGGVCTSRMEYFEDHGAWEVATTHTDSKGHTTSMSAQNVRDIDHASAIASEFFNLVCLSVGLLR